MSITWDRWKWRFDSVVAYRFLWCKGAMVWSSLLIFTLSIDDFGLLSLSNWWRRPPLSAPVPPHDSAEFSPSSPFTTITHPPKPSDPHQLIYNEWAMRQNARQACSVIKSLEATCSAARAQLQDTMRIKVRMESLLSLQITKHWLPSAECSWRTPVLDFSKHKSETCSLLLPLSS